MTQAITLTANTNADFQLPRTPTAAFTAEGPLMSTRRSDGSVELAGVAVNSGDACAVALTGTTTITGTNGTTVILTWSLSPSPIIRPGDRVVYPVGVLTSEQSAAIGNGSYVTTFAFTSTGC